MKLLTLKRIGIALVVLVFLWGAVEIFTGRTDEIARVATIGAVTADATDTVAFLGATDTIRLTRDGGGWRVNDHAASPEALTELFDALGQDVQGQLVARSPTSHGRMGVDSTGTELRIVAGGEVATRLVIGNQGAGYQTRYVRPAGDDRVYLIDGVIARMLVREVSDWRDKRIVTLDVGDIYRIAVRRGREAYTLERRDTVWAFADGAATDTAAIRRLLDGWGSVTAQGSQPFATAAQADSANFTQPDRTVALFDASEDTLARLLFDSTDAGFLVRHDLGGTVYTLMRWRVNELVPADSSLRGKVP